MRIAGFDIGLDGAVAILDAESGMILAAWPTPTFELRRGGKNKRELDIAAVCDRLAPQMPLGHAFVEQIGSMPGQGVSGVFAFGKAYGIVLGMLGALGVPTTLVPPATWKKALRVPAAKDGARARASEMLPQSAKLWAPQRGERNAKQCAGMAEAALIAYLGSGAAAKDRVVRLRAHTVRRVA